MDLPDVCDAVEIISRKTLKCHVMTYPFAMVKSAVHSDGVLTELEYIRISPLSRPMAIRRLSYMSVGNMRNLVESSHLWSLSTGASATAVAASGTLMVACGVHLLPDNPLICQILT